MTAPARSLSLFGDDEVRTADISADGVYRYRLTRIWDRRRPNLVFVMLNPSTADGISDDATIRRCIAFARRDGFGGIVVVNMYALRSTDPRMLLEHPEPIGIGNDHEIARAARDAAQVCVAWGAHSAATPERVRDVIRAIGREVVCLGITKDGAPNHPLRLHSDSLFLPWRNAA